MHPGLLREPSFIPFNEGEHVQTYRVGETFLNSQVKQANDNTVFVTNIILDDLML
jgi:hypothetical protein